MKFDVHICAIVRVKVPGVEAKNMTEAAKIAENSLDLDRHFNQVNRASSPLVTEYDEVHHFVVDEYGDTEFKNTRFLDTDGNIVLDP